VLAGVHAGEAARQVAVQVAEEGVDPGGGFALEGTPKRVRGSELTVAVSFANSKFAKE